VALRPGIRLGRPLARTTLVETLTALSSEQDRLDRDEALSPTYESTFGTCENWEWATALGFLFPFDFTDESEEVAYVLPHIKRYFQHLTRPSSSLSLDLGNLWFLHWSLCSSDLHAWGWVFHDLLQIDSPDAENYFDLESLYRRYSDFSRRSSRPIPTVGCSPRCASSSGIRRARTSRGWRGGNARITSHCAWRCSRSSCST